MLGRRTTLVARKASAHLTRSLLGARSFSSKQRGLYDDDAPVGNMKIETVEVKPESEHAGFSTAHRFNIGSATMPLAKQNEGPSVTGYNHNKALNDENEPPVVIPKHLQYEPARPCDDALLIGTCTLSWMLGTARASIFNFLARWRSPRSPPPPSPPTSSHLPSP